MCELQRCLEELRAALGEECVVTDPAVLATHSIAARYDDGGRAAFMLSPRTTEAVSAAISVCRRNSVQLVPQGADTGLVGAAVPDSSGLQGILSLRQLNRMIDIDLDNRSVRVSAGVRLSELNEALERHDLTYPVDLGADPSIGGMVATNTGGARFIRYGDVRRSILGLQVVLPDHAGSVMELGHGLRKDNSGLDLKQLFVGTGGAVGIITWAELEVQPMPRQSATAMIVPAGRDAVTPLLLAAEHAFGHDLTSFEGMSRAALSCVFRHIPGTFNPFAPDAVPEYVVLVELTRSTDEHDANHRLSEHLARFLEREFEAGRIVNAVMNRPNELWRIRHSISEALREVGIIIGLDISLRRGDLARFHEEASELVTRHFPWLTVCDFGHCGDGGVHMNLVWPHTGAPPYDDCAAAEARGKIYELVVHKFGGSFSAEHGIGPANARYRELLLSPGQLRMEAQLIDLIAGGRPLGRAYG